MSDITDVQNAIVDESLHTFQNAMSLGGQIAWNDLEPYLQTSETFFDSSYLNDGGYNQSIGNLQVYESLTHGKESVNYEAGVEDLKTALDDLWDVTFEYYSNEHGQLAQAYLSMTKGLVTTMKKDIDNTFGYTREGNQYFFDQVVAPAQLSYKGSLTDNINNLGKTHVDTMVNDMQHRVEDRFFTYSVTASSTIMQQFTRRLNDIFSQYFQLVWAKYEGVDDGVTREFCHDRLNEQKYYHVEQIKLWPEMYSPWDGEIPNTDRGSIFVNLGGFSCRHNLEYVAASEVPDNLKQEANAKGYKIT